MHIALRFMMLSVVNNDGYMYLYNYIQKWQKWSKRVYMATLVK